MLRRAVLRWLDFLLDKPWLALLLFGAFIAVSGLALTQVEFDQSTDSFFDQDAAYSVDRRTLEESFGGSGGEIIVTLTAPDIFTPTNLSLVARLTEAFEKLDDNVEKVISLTTVNDTIGEKENFIVEKLVKDIPEDADGCAKIRARALSNPLYVKNVVSADGRTAGVIIRTRKATDSASKSRPVLMKNLRALLEAEVPPGVEWHVSGSVTLDVDYQSFMQHDMSIFLPLAIGLMGLVLVFTLRRVRLMMMPMVVVGISLTFTMSLLYWFDFKINSITVTVPPIIMGVVIGDSIHYVLHALRHRKGDRKATLMETTRRMLFPCLMTTVTTCIGFLSLLTSRSPAMRQLGTVASCGVLIAYGVTFMLLPAVMRLFCRLNDPGLDALMESRPEMDRADRILNRLSDFYIRRHKAIVLVSAVVGLTGLVWLWQIKVETSMLEQLNPKSSTYRHTVFVEKHLTGIEMLYVSMKHKDADGFKDPVVLQAMESMQEQIVAIPGVDKALSAADFIKDMNKSFNDEQASFYKIPDTRQMIAQYSLLYGADDLEDYISPDWSWAVMRVRLNVHVTSEMGTATEAVWKVVKAGLPPGVTVDLLGPVRTEVEGVDTVVRGQIWSLIMSFGVVFAIMFVAFRSFSAGLVSVLPNVLPLFVNFGIMGIAGIRLDTATSLISAIAIGIIVDNTIHFLDGYRQYLHETGNHEEAMRKTVVAKGRAVLFTTLVLVCSFGVLVFSAFIPIFQFGMLCSILMVTAMVGDLMVMPCLALWVKPRFSKSVAPVSASGKD